MANVFDYVVPITRVAELADTIHACVNGDTTRLKWLIDFAVKPA